MATVVPALPQAQPTVPNASLLQERFNLSCSSALHPQCCSQTRGSHLCCPSAAQRALEMGGERSFSMHMYIGGEPAAKVNTTLPFPKMSSRNCKGSCSKRSVSDPLCT